jgi:hypothetical protein
MANGSSTNNSTPLTNSIFDWNNHLIPPEQKDEAWALKLFQRYVPYLQPIWSVDWAGGGNRQWGINDIRGYAMGTQDTTVYKTYFDPQDKTGKFLGLSFDNIPAFIPRLRQKLLADLQKIPTEIKAQAVDEAANDKRNKDKMMLRIEKILDEHLSKLSKIINPQNPEIKSGISKKVLNPNMPNIGGGGQDGIAENLKFDFEDDYELQLFMDKNSGFYNQNCELVQELAIESMFKLNKIEDRKQQLIEDAVDYGRAAVRAYCNKFTGMPQIDTVPINTVRVPQSFNKDLDKCECWATYNMVTLSELLRYIGDCVDEDELKRIYNSAVKTYAYTDSNQRPIPMWNNANYPSWNNFNIVRIPLYYMEFRSPNKETYKESTTKYGDTKLKKQGFYADSDGTQAPDGSVTTNGKVKQVWYDTIYKGYYIYGLEPDVNKVYDFGALNNMIRTKGSEQYTPYTLIYWRFEDRSCIEKMIPHADNATIAWLKLQYTLLKAKPPGISWNINAIQNIVLGDGGKISEIELAKMYEQTGSTFHQTIDEAGNPIMANANSPHMILPNGIDPNAMVYWNTIRAEMQLMSDSVGLNEYTDASTPNPDSLVGIQKMAVLNSQDARYYLHYGIKRIIENLATRTSAYIQQIVKYSPTAKAQLENMIGAYNVDMIDMLGESPLHDYAIYLEDMMSEQEKQEVKQFLLQSYSQGKLDLSDVLQLYFIKNFKLLSKLLSLKYQKRAAQQMQMQAAGMQAQQQSEMQMAQLKMQLQALDNQGKVQQAETVGKMNLLVEQMKEQGDNYRKLLSEYNKTNIAKAQMDHEKGMAENAAA